MQVDSESYEKILIRFFSSKLFEKKFSLNINLKKLQ